MVLGRPRSGTVFGSRRYEWLQAYNGLVARLDPEVDQTEDDSEDLGVALAPRGPCRAFAAGRPPNVAVPSRHMVRSCS